MAEYILDSRLSAALRLVRNGAVAADIGTDHGYLICELVASGKCPRGYACDINSGPLKQAERNIMERGLEGKVAPILTNGLSGLDARGIEDILVLGMGGELIGEIVTEALWTKNTALHFVLQPMTKAERLRKTLHRSGFEIISETAVRSGRFVYAVQSVKYTGFSREIDELFAWTGRIWHNEDTISAAYLRGVAGRIQKQADGLSASGKMQEQAEALRELVKIIRERADSICRL